MAQDRVSMPMASAGIIGFSPDVKIAGYEVDPKMLILFVTLVVIIVHAAAYAVSFGATPAA